MRRCYRNVALVLSSVLIAGNTFSNSSSSLALQVYAAENTLSEETVATESIKTLKNWRIYGNLLTTEAVNSNESLVDDSFTIQKCIETGEENVETEIPTEENITQKYQLESNDYDTLLKIVEAEAGCEDLTGKMLVANVILNRVNSDQFPDTVSEVVYQKQGGTAQFSPTVDGSIERVTVSEETVTAVNQVLQGEDFSLGALFFRSVHCSSKWHDNNLTRIIEHGNHIFYTI